MTERLVLRQFTAADVDGLLELDGDPAVMRFISRKTRSRAEIEAEVLPRFLGYYARYRDFGHWAADTRRPGRPAATPARGTGPARRRPLPRRPR